MIAVVKYFIILGIWARVEGHHDSNSKEKRILLKDPSYVEEQFDHLQSEFQDLLVKVNNQQNTIASQQTTIDSLESKLATQLSGRGVTFIRWGRTECPENFTSIYTGYAGGSWYNHTGAAAEYICMPGQPIWGPNKNKLVGDKSVGYVYGAEYEGTLYGVQDNHYDVPCVVCQSWQYSLQIMIPGRTLCHSGWTEAYYGDLSSGYFNHVAASQYVCVDHLAEIENGDRDTNDDGKLFYHVKSKCGALRCPPYEDDKILACVVCVK